MSRIPCGSAGLQKPKIVITSATQSTVDPQTNTILSENTSTNVTQVNPCPNQSSARPSGLRPPGSQLRTPSQFRPPGQVTTPAQIRARPSQLRPPGQQGVPSSSGVCQPCTAAQSSPGIIPPQRSPLQQAAVPSGLQHPGQYAGPSGMSQGGGPSGLQYPGTPAGQTGIRPPSGLRQPAGGFRPSALRPPGQTQQPCGSPAMMQQQSAGQLPSAAGQQPSGLRPPSSLRQPSGLRPPSSGIQTPSGLRVPSGLRPPATSARKDQQSVEDEVREMLDAKVKQHPGEKQFAKGKRVNQAPGPQTMITPVGREHLLQRTILEERVERDNTGERVVKNISLVDVNEATGAVEQVDLGMQQIDPRYPKTDGREVIGVISTISITPTYKTISKDTMRVSTGPADLGINMTPAQVAQLVEEEKADVENTLKMVPPDLTISPGKYGIKQRLQRFRLNSESMALLEQSIIQPEVTADEPQAEPTPEVMATMMHTIEKGISPQVSPDQVFNTLFQETTNEQFLELNSVSPGPLQDVVVPVEVPKAVHQEVLSNDMSKLCERMANVSNSDDVPYVDIFTRVMDDVKKSPESGKNKPRSFQPIKDEKSLWVNANMEYLVNVVGAEPVDVLDPWNWDELETSGNAQKEMCNGMDFFIDCNPLQYVSRVQLRGSQQPSYFPGYMVALPDFPEIVKIAKSPDEVFASAWKSVQPKYFDENSTQSIIC